MNIRKYLIVVLGLLLLSLGRASTGAIAQNNMILTVALEPYEEEALGMNFFDQFEAQHNVQVRVVSAGQSAILPSVTDNNSAEAHLNAFEAYVQVADVLPMASYKMSVEATRAGYLLDLMPLISADTRINSADFYRVAWEAYQWDGGMWMLPSAMSVTTYVYDTSAFDAVGATYPNANWTLTDIGNLARALTERDANNAVITPVFGVFEIGNLFRSLLARGVYDANTFPNQPNFSDPALINLVNEWVALETEGVIVRNGFNPSDVPFVLGNVSLASANDVMQMSPLAGNTVGVYVDGFAVSAGTQYPELAYELAKYMTDGYQLFISDLPARQSLGTNIDPMLADALPNAFSYSELRYFEYINLAIDRMIVNGVDALEALQFAQTTAENNLQMAESRRGATNIVVANAPQVQDGDIELNFGVFTTVMPMPNETIWRDLADDFAEFDPEVGYVNVEAVNDFPVNLAQTNDCFYHSSNITSDLTASDVLVLDPLISTDVNVNQDDYVTGVLAQLRRDNQLLGLPIGVQPVVMWYDTNAFSQIGLDLTQGTWSINQFNDALQTLPAPSFSATNASNRALLMLMGAYGGLPVDFRTSPATLNFTDPTTVDAIQQVLDLARSNQIDYRSLANINNGGNAPDLNSLPMHTDQLGSLSIRGAMRNGGAFGTDSATTDTYALVNFPQGVYTPVSYSIPSAYISTNAPYVEACYRWIQYLADHPDSLNLMPATYSLLNDPAYMATQSADFMAFFSSFAGLLQDPNVVVVPNTFSWRIGSDVPMVWLNRAFDNYVLNGADLMTELTQAEQFTLAYQACIADIAPFDPNVQDRQAYQELFNACARQVDPSL